MEKERKYRFFLHYNKPLSRERKIPIWTVHFRNKCYFTQNIQCNVITESKINKTQPYAVIQGKCREIREIDNKLIII